MMMKIKKWLIVNDRGQCRLTKGKPNLDMSEVAIHLEIEVPDALFTKPRLEAKITVPDEAAATDVINTAVSDNLQNVIEQATGLTFSIGIAKQGDSDE